MNRIEPSLSVRVPSLFCLTVQDEGKKFYNLDARKDDFKDEVKSKILEKYGGQVQ